MLQYSAINTGQGAEWSGVIAASCTAEHPDVGYTCKCKRRCGYELDKVYILKKSSKKSKVSVNLNNWCRRRGFVDYRVFFP